MIISSGWAKGLSLKTPKGEITRPTSARVRGAILNMLMPWTQEALVLDLFGGSGAIGIEAVSRGARGAVFVERDPGALAALRLNVTELERRAHKQGLDVAPLEVVSGEVAQLLQNEKQLIRWGPYDVIFVDPPYADTAMWAQMLLVKLTSMLTPQGVVVFETATGAGAKAVLAVGGETGWDVLKQKSYGDTIVIVLTQSSLEAQEEAPEV